MTQLSLVPVFEVPNSKPLEINPYETYARLFPNPNLNAEIMEREKLLQAISAADHAVAVNPKQAKSSWFSWGSKKEEETPIEHMDLEDDDRLVYSKPWDETCTFPMMKIEYSAIPVEAHALARYQMASRSRFATVDEGTVDLIDGRLFDLSITDRASLPDGTCFAASAALVLVYNGASRSPVAQIPPSPAIFQKLAEHFFLQQDDDTALLQIVGLRIISKSILVIARLGGFIEFVDVGGGRRSTIALTTSEYHTDLLGIEVVGETSILAYGGMLDDDVEVTFASDDEHSVSTGQVMTLWEYSGQGNIDLKQVVSLEIPPSSMIFSNSSAVARYWRIPRSVRLRAPEDGPPVQQRWPTTVHFPTPIVQIAIAAHQWAVVDGLGGVTLYKVTSDQVSVQHNRSALATHLDMALFVSAAYQEELLFLLTKSGDLYSWNDGSSVPVSRYARSLLSTRPIRILMEEPDAIKVATLQTTIGTDTIGMLIHSGNIQQALSVGKHLALPDLETCRKETWEESLDLMILSDIKDTAYIVQQAMSPLRMGLDLFRNVCSLALARIESARLGELVSFAASAEDGKAIGDSLRSRITLCGTYELLCNHLDFQPTLSHYLEDFLASSIDDITLQFASAGDIPALSLLWFRHPPKKPLDVLNAIPLAMDPTMYVHLLPCPCTSDHKSWFISEKNQRLVYDEFPAYIEATHGVKVVQNDVDLKAVSEYGSQTQMDRAVIGTWLSERANALSNFLGSVDLTNKFTKMAITILDVKDTKKAGMSEQENDLMLLHQFSDMLCSFARDEGEAITSSPLATTNPQALADMSAKDLATIVLVESSSNALTIQRRYKHLLIPLLDLGHRPLANLDNDVATSCFQASIDTVDVLNWMSQRTELLKAARLSDSETERIIKDSQLCFDVGLSILRQSFSVVKGRSNQSIDAKAVVERFWRMYECLPDLSESFDIDRLSALSDRTDQLYVDLIAVDLCVGWISTSTVIFSYFPIHFCETMDELGRLKAGNDLASLCCKSFFDQVIYATCQDTVQAVLTTLLDDLKDLNQLCFQGKLDLRRIIYDSLARPLLLGHHILVLGSVLELAGNEMIDVGQLSDEVLTIYNAALYGEESSEDEIRAAAQFHDVLGRWMPSIMEEFATSKTFLDASHLISNVLCAEQKGCVLLPRDIRRMRPIEVIDFVMESFPSCFIQHCPEWKDISWATTANNHMRRHFDDRNGKKFPENEQTQIPLPPLPGIPVFRLAELIGLNDIASIIAVKSRIIHYGAKACLFGASAAICRTLVADAVAANVDALATFEAVALIVSEERYQDAATKKELCIASLQLRNTALLHNRAASLVSITHTFEGLELNWLLDRPFENGAVRHLMEGTQSDYSVSLLDLLGSLQQQMCDLVCDDELLIVIARYAFFWCIGRAAKPILYPYHPFFATASDSVLAFASALSLHVDDDEKFSTLFNEISTIFSSQMAVAANQLPHDSVQNWKDPDQSLVDRLIHRGYSECGARRAVASTNNVGFDVAVQWAVQHSLDDNFDDPMLLVRPHKDMRLDKESVALYQECMALLAARRVQPNIPIRNFTDSKKFDNVSSALIGSKNNIDDDAWSDDDGLDLDRDFEDQELKNKASEARATTSNDAFGTHDSSEAAADGSALVGGWDDRDEIEFDGGLDEIHDSNDGNGWGDDDVDLNTILEGEHETSELFVSTPNKMVTSQIGVLAAETTEEKQEVENTGWDDDVDFEDLSESIGNEDAPAETSGPPAVTVDTEICLDEPKASRKALPKINGHLSEIIDLEDSNVERVQSSNNTTTTTTAPRTQMEEPSIQEQGMEIPDASIDSVAPKQEMETSPRACITLEPPRSAPLPRSKLLEVGQEAFANARKACSPSNEERQRLIEQGRAFLKQMKSRASSSSLQNMGSTQRSFFADEHRSTSSPAKSPVSADFNEALGFGEGSFEV